MRHIYQCTRKTFDSHHKGSHRRQHHCIVPILCSSKGSHFITHLGCQSYLTSCNNRAVVNSSRPWWSAAMMKPLSLYTINTVYQEVTSACVEPRHLLYEAGTASAGNVLTQKMDDHDGPRCLVPQYGHQCTSGDHSCGV